MELGWTTHSREQRAGVLAAASGDARCSGLTAKAGCGDSTTLKAMRTLEVALQVARGRRRQPPCGRQGVACRVGCSEGRTRVCGIAVLRAEKGEKKDLTLGPSCQGYIRLFIRFGK